MFDFENRRNLSSCSVSPSSSLTSLPPLPSLLPLFLHFFPLNQLPGLCFVPFFFLYLLFLLLILLPSLLCNSSVTFLIPLLDTRSICLSVSLCIYILSYQSINQSSV